MKKYNITTYKISEIVAKNYSTSFYTASLFFSGEIRKAIFSIYGFVRFVDEIVDSFHQHDKKALFNKFKQDLKEALEAGISLNPILNSFALTVTKYHIEYELIESFLSSMRKDLTVSDYSLNNQINSYIYGSAEVVGLMCLKVFCNGNDDQYKQLMYSARKLGEAFQKVNFIRDLREDIFELNRYYFPEIKNSNFDDQIKNKIIADIENDFSIAYAGIKKLPKQTKPAVYIAYLYYKKLLNKIKKTPVEKIIRKRIRVPDFIKLMIMIKGGIYGKFLK